MGKNIKLNASLFYALLLTCSIALPVYSQTQPDQKPENTLPLFPELDESDVWIENEPKYFFSFLDKPQKIISSSFENFVRRTDEFFANEKVFYETSGSYLRLTGEAIYQEGGNQGYYSDLKIKVKLPKTEKKVSLLVESNPSEEEDEIEKALEDTPQEAISEKEYFAGVQTTVGEKQTWQFKPSLGIRLGSPVDYYTRFRLTREAPLAKGSFLFRQSAYWFDSSGWEADTSGEVNRSLIDNLLFRSTTGANWQEETDETKLRQIFSLTHKLSDRRAISYQVRFDGINVPTTHTTRYSLTAHYRQHLHDDYLFMDLIPQVTYRKEYDFRADYSFIFRLEIVFKR